MSDLVKQSVGEDEWPTSLIYEKVLEARRSSKVVLVPTEFLVTNPAQRDLMVEPLAGLEQEMMEVDCLQDKPLYGVLKEGFAPLVFDGGHRAVVSMCVSMVWMFMKPIDIPYEVAVTRAAILTHALKVTESAAENLGVLAQVRLFGAAKDEFMKKERKRSTVISNKHQPRSWHTERAYHEMMHGAPAVRGQKHFVQSKNSNYHKGAEVLLEAGVIDTMCTWEAKGWLKWLFKELVAVGKWTPEKVAEQVAKWEQIGPEKIPHFDGTFSANMARAAAMTGTKYNPRIRVTKTNVRCRTLEETKVMEMLAEQVRQREIENQNLKATVQQVELELELARTRGRDIGQGQDVQCSNVVEAQPDATTTVATSAKGNERHLSFNRYVKDIESLEHDLSEHPDCDAVVVLLRRAREELLRRRNE